MKLLEGEDKGHSMSDGDNWQLNTFYSMIYGTISMFMNGG
jgi:hypothetical protein